MNRQILSDKRKFHNPHFTLVRGRITQRNIIKLSKFCWISRRVLIMWFEVWKTIKLEEGRACSLVFPAKVLTNSSKNGHKSNIDIICRLISKKQNQKNRLKNLQQEMYNFIKAQDIPYNKRFIQFFLWKISRNLIRAFNSKIKIKGSLTLFSLMSRWQTALSQQHWTTRI